MPLTKEEEKELFENIFKKLSDETEKQISKELEKELQHLRNNFSNQLQGFRKELENHSKENKEANKAISIATDKLQKTVNELVIALNGSEYDKENSFFARFKRLETVVETFKENKSFVLGGWFGVTVVIAGSIGFLITVWQFFKHLIK